MFQVKICGVASVEDALLAAAAGADAVGLNFVPSSRRYIDDKTAKAISQSLPAGVVRVGVFANASVAAMLAAREYVGLDMIQLHGDESPEVLAHLTSVPVIKALRCPAGENRSRETGFVVIEEYVDACRNQGRVPDAILLDSASPGVASGQFGGTGMVCDWSTASRYAGRAELPPLILAGGLHPANVAEAIAAVRPAAVDTASGVEAMPGRKDAELTRAFVQAARAAFGGA